MNNHLEPLELSSQEQRVLHLALNLFFKQGRRRGFKESRTLRSVYDRIDAAIEEAK